MNTKDLLKQARQAVAESPCDPRKLTAIHAGITAAASLFVALLTYLLSSGMGSTGGLSGIGTRALLETAQSVLSLAVNILSPFWALGFTAVVLGIARRQEVGSRTLTAGFRIWGPALRLTILEGVIVFFVAISASQVGSYLFLLTPFADSLNALLAPLAESETMDIQAVSALLMTLDQAAIMDIFWRMIPFIVLPLAAVLIPLSYRLRLAQFLLLDQPRMGALAAIVLSFRLMKKNCLKLFALDLRLWWFYALELLVLMLSYGDLLVPEGPGVLLTFLFYALALVAQLGLYVWQKPQVMTTYALFYDGLLPKEAPQEEI